MSNEEIKQQIRKMTYEPVLMSERNAGEQAVQECAAWKALDLLESDDFVMLKTYALEHNLIDESWRHPTPLLAIKLIIAREAMGKPCSCAGMREERWYQVAAENFDLLQEARGERDRLREENEKLQGRAERLSAGVADIAQYGLGLPDVPEDGAVSERVRDLRLERDRLQGRAETSQKEAEYANNQLAAVLEADRRSRELLAEKTGQLTKASEEILGLREEIERLKRERNAFEQGVFSCQSMLRKAFLDAEQVEDSLRSKLAAAKDKSESRKKSLFEVGEERRKEWQRAERAEAELSASKEREEGITRQYQKSMELLAAAEKRAEEGFRLGLDAGRAESKEREEKLAKALIRLRDQVGHSVMGTAGNRIDFRDEISRVDEALRDRAAKEQK